MRKYLISFILIFASVYSSAQITAVTATITDSDNFTWTNAQWSVSFTPNASYPNVSQYTINGVPLSSATYSSYLSQKGFTNSSGQLGLNLLDNTIIQPAGSFWTFTIKSNTTAQATLYQPVQIFGSSQSLTTFLSTQSVAPRFPAQPGAYGYGDVELSTVPYPGGTYFNTTTLFPRFWNGFVWANLAGAIGITSINGYQGAVFFTGAVTCSGNPLTCNFTGGGGGGGFTLNVAEMGALSSGMNPTLTHTNKYAIPQFSTTAQINAFLTTYPYGTFEFQNGDVSNSFTNLNWTAQITHDNIYFFHSTMNWDGIGVVSDGRIVQGTMTSGSNVLHIASGFGQLFNTQDVGKVVWTTGVVGGIPTAFEPQIASITDANDAVMTVNAPYNQSSPVGMYLGTDNTTNAQAATAFGNLYTGGYGPAALLTLSGGMTLLHTQQLQGTSMRGAGIITNLVNAPGENLFQACDPNVCNINQGENVHVSDIGITLNTSIDSTQPWQIINQSGTTSVAAAYNPGYVHTVESNTPTSAPWIIGPGPNNGGAINGIATTNGTTTICIPSASIKFPNTTGLSQIMFPYQSTLLETTVSSTSGSCAGGFTGFTLSASIPAGTQQEWFAGTNIQHTTIDFPTSPSFPFTLTVANSIAPSPSSEWGAAPYGLIKIGSRSCLYNGYSKTGTYSYNLTSCTGTNTDAPLGSFIAPLNPFKPTYPWPVVPTLNIGDTTPTSTAAYFPGHNVGVVAFQFPQASGISGQSGGWFQSKIENIYITADNNAQVNNTGCFYMVGTPYTTVFDNIRCIGTVYGIVQATPALESHNYIIAQPTAFNMKWSNVTIKARYTANFINMQSGIIDNWDNYAGNGGVAGGAGLFITYGWDDQLGNGGTGVFNSTIHNVFTESEGTSASFEPLFELDGSQNQVYNWNQGGGGEVYIGGDNWHFFAGQFNNNGGPPIINYADGATFDYVGRIGSEPIGNVYGVNQFINWGPRTRAYGRTSALIGPYGNLAYGGRSIYDGQTNETFNTGNLTVPYPYSNSGLITPDEYAAGNYDPIPMSTLWTFDSTAAVTQANAACNVGTSTGTSYCAPYRFNDTLIPINPGERLVPGKYMVYASFKSGLASNSFYFGIGGINGSCSTGTTIVAPAPVSVTNNWPTTAAGVYSTFIDLTSYGGCNLRLLYNGATSADTIYNQFIDFAPLPENFNAQQVTIQGTGNPTITNSNGAETWQTTTPVGSTCGTTWANGTIWHNLNGTAAGVNRFYICDSATTTWNAKF